MKGFETQVQFALDVTISAAEHCPAMKGFETQVAAIPAYDGAAGSRALPRNEGV